MASLGTIKIEVTGMPRARLLVVELTEIERELGREGLSEYAVRINHALKRFTDGSGGDFPDDPPRRRT
jgi:hypothetical protein